MPDTPIIPEASNKSSSDAQADVTQNRFAEQYDSLNTQFHELCAKFNVNTAILVVKTKDNPNDPICVGTGHAWHQAVLAAKVYKLKKSEAIEELDSITK